MFYFSLTVINNSGEITTTESRNNKQITNYLLDYFRNIHQECCKGTILVVYSFGDVILFVNYNPD